MILHKRTYLEEFGEMLHKFPELPQTLQNEIYEGAFRYYLAASKYSKTLRIKILPLSHTDASLNETLEEIRIVDRDCSTLAQKLNELARSTK